MKTVHIPLANRPYNIFVGNSKRKDYTGVYELAAPHITGRKCFIITDSNVANLYLTRVKEELTAAKAASVGHAVFPPGERSKNLSTVQLLYAEVVKAGLDRESMIVALGGGVVGDVAGFVAATYMRGIDYIQIPTSLVAQVDSSVGGKTGVDLQEGKNMVGAFHQPKAVLIDTAMLTTLPDRQLRCGLAEVVKYGVILDADFFEYLELNVNALLNVDAPTYEHVILRCCQLKSEVVTADEYDTGLRAILNYGHTFGHALETLMDYRGLTHGEAIAIGMCMAADLSRRLEESPVRVESLRRQEALLDAIGLPTKISGFTPQQVLDAMRNDKKFTKGTKRFILSERLGRAKIVSGIDDDLILQAIRGRCDN